MKNYIIEFGENKDSEMKCPVCGHDYVHLSSAVEIPPTFCEWRQGMIAVAAYCETDEEHHWWVCFGHHKGKVYTYIQIRKQP